MGSISLFPHVHVEGGVVICHSHPFSGTADDPGHTHSAEQYETIAQLSLAIFLVAVISGAVMLTRPSRVLPADLPVLRPYCEPLTADHPRGPPCR